MASNDALTLYQMPAKGTPVTATFPKEETIQFTRESFARVMVDQRLFSAFGDYVKMEHCGENIEFYQELSKLEDLIACGIMATSIQEADAYSTARKAGSTHSLARFLRYAATTSQSCSENTTEASSAATSVLISLPPLPSQAPPPPDLKSHYINIFTTFIAQGAPMEINVTDATRKRIASKLATIIPSHTASSIPTDQVGAGSDNFPCTVFDSAGDEIIDLLYRDTFKRFVNYYSKNLSQFTHALSVTESPSSTPTTSSRPSHDMKRPQRKEKELKQDSSLGDPMEDLSPEIAMMLLAQAAIRAEQERDSKAQDAGKSPQPKKKTDLAFWRRKKERSDSTASTTSLSGTSGEKGVKTSSSLALEPSPPQSRRNSASSQASTGTTSTTPQNQDGETTKHRRKNSIFSNSKPNLNNIQAPLPTSVPNRTGSPMKYLDNSPKRSPANSLPALDMSAPGLKDDVGNAVDLAPAPKSAGWAGFLVKTPTGSGGGWFGRKTGSNNDVLTTDEDAPPVPTIPGHLKKQKSSNSLKDEDQGGGGAGGGGAKKKSIFSSWAALDSE
ncbi:hypothetical protein HDU97_006078 [Phlyctochytrium planicorne]|nr:hypothetical protein HDU97_006078 [Phlyctochytrium planicorne]